VHYLVNPIEECEDPQLEMISLKTGGVYGMVEAELRIIMTEILARLKGRVTQNDTLNPV
jgi:hypothetical protein